MVFFKKRSLLIFCPILLCIPIFGKDSITAQYSGYVDICRQAAEDDVILNNFRSMPSYRCALEIDDGETFCQYIRNRSSKLLQHLDEFRLLDRIGNPPLIDYEGIGFFTATTLRYVFHADQIVKRFKLPEGAKVVEIGVGFGGQSYILQKVHPCSIYYMYDLPEVEKLVDRVMDQLTVKTVQCLPLDEDLPEETIDLVISNYAYSECDREMQLVYFDRVIKKADRGYFIYNKIAITDYGLDSIPLHEFIDLLKKNGCNPRVSAELFSGAGNFLITWDKTDVRGNRR